MRQAAIIGGGLIGRSWAIVFARAGWQVNLYDPDPQIRDTVHDRMGTSLAQLQAHNLIGDPADILQRITSFSDPGFCVEGVEIVQENGPEKIDIKQAIFAELDAAADPETIIASSSSYIPVSKVAETVEHRERCLVGHPVNPPHLAPVVEICGAPWTSDESLSKARSIYTAVGQSPVTVNSEINGFVLNRLQAAVMSEAFRLVGDGIVSPDDLDTTIRDGLGLRWSFIGPFETIELNAPEGIADYCKRYGASMASLAEDPAKENVWEDENVQKVLAACGIRPDKDALLKKSQWRDDRLTALQAHKKSQPEAPS